MNSRRSILVALALLTLAAAPAANAGEVDGIARLTQLAIQHERRDGAEERVVGRGMMIAGAGAALGATILAAPVLPLILAGSAAAIGVGAWAAHAGGNRVANADAADALRRAGFSDLVITEALFGTNSPRPSPTAGAAVATPSTTSNTGFHH